MRSFTATGQMDNEMGEAGSWVVHEFQNKKGIGTGHNTKIYVMAALMDLFESYLLIAQEVLITVINWRSQIDTYFSGYTCYGPPNECCYQASKTILEYVVFDSEGRTQLYDLMNEVKSLTTLLRPFADDPNDKN